MSEFETEGENINVIVRIKPEEINKELSSIKIKDSSIEIKVPSKKEKKYLFDYIGEKSSTQEEIFEQCGKNICDHALKGYNCTIFAYGQTGSGKTYTLLGKKITDIIENKSLILSSDADIIMNENNVNYANNFEYDRNNEKIGLVSRILYYLFKNSSEMKEDNEFSFKMRYVEIYKEKIIDLLNPDNNQNYENTEENEEPKNDSANFLLRNVVKLNINSPTEAINYIINGNRKRHTAPTLKNIKSSRSHAIIIIYIKNNSLIENKRKKSVFHIIDLAGSESQKKTEAKGERLKEAGANNESLLNLGRVIRAIINNENNIPYRDSKLTTILKDSLGGNAKTSIIATISQLESDLKETINTLEFVKDAKKIKNKAIINEEQINKEEKIKNFNNLLIENCEQLGINRISAFIEKQNLFISFKAQNEEIIKLKNNMSEKENELRKIKEENNNLKSISENKDIIIKANENELSNLKNEKIELKDKIKNLEIEIDKNNNNMKNIEIRYNNEILNMEKKNKQLEELNSKNISLINELQKENKKIKDMKDKDDKTLTNEFNNLKAEKNNLQNQIENLKEEIIKNNEVIKNMEIKHKKELLDIEQKNKELIENNTKNDFLIKEFQENNRKDKQQLDIKQKEINDGQTELEKLNMEILNYKNKESTQKKEIENKKKQIDALEKQINQINQKYENSKKLISTYIEKISSLSNDNNCLVNQINYIKKELSNIIGSSYFDQNDCSKSIDLFEEINKNAITAINNGAIISDIIKNMQSLYSLGMQIINNKCDKINNICDKLLKLFELMN